MKPSPDAPTELSQPASARLRPPGRQGLYDPAMEHDACGMGFVAHLKGQASPAILHQALTVLANLTHRGARGSEPNTGDGAGIMLQMPDAFLRRVMAEKQVDLPPAGGYGVGVLFLPQDPEVRAALETDLDALTRAAGHPVLGWRHVPTDNRALGQSARAGEPVMRQLFVGPRSGAIPVEPLEFERQLYALRRQAERALRDAGRSLYFASFSARTLVYKGMLLAEQLADYFPDLAALDMATAIALVHSRFSTNTFPNWERAHPYRYIIHNGEINTLRGNVNWARAREALIAADDLHPDLAEALPLIDPKGSDTAMFDNFLEFLVLSGRTLPHAIMMMIPEPWSRHQAMDPARRAFYEYHMCLMEPWDGPAAMAFTDGVQVGAVLDRNGLRPGRYYVTRDDLVIMASEVGVLDVRPDQVLAKGRLQPGRLLLVDTAQGRLIDDSEIKQAVAADRPYRRWLDDNLLDLDRLPESTPARQMTARPETDLDHRRRQHLFGYTHEELRLLLTPMALSGVEALGSMGDDTPPAVLSTPPQLLYNYFKQLFAQVTNPPIDAIREALVTDTQTLLGPEASLLTPGPANARRIRLPHPILTGAQLATLQQLASRGFSAHRLDSLFPAGRGEAGLSGALERLFAAADRAVADGATLLILSDRAVSRAKAPIPAMLAVAGLHHHLIRSGNRPRVSLIVDSGEPREVHHFACLIGYGADAIHPYLALDSLQEMLRRGLLRDVDYPTAERNYIRAVVKGVVKILSKMGISTIQSYRGAQVYEALGLNQRVVDRYFTGTPSRLEGIGLEVIAAEAVARHAAAFNRRNPPGEALPAGGRYQVREGGEPHLFNPRTVHALQKAVRSGDHAAYQEYAAEVNDRQRQLCTLRGLLELRPAARPVPLAEVEPVGAIIRRFKTGAMSYGSISAEAHETLAIAMNRIGGKSNTGEGGEDPARYRPEANGDSRLSAIKQVASARFGVTSEYLVNAQELQIKMAQGAKPGEGGQLPGHKVYPWIARVRHATPGVGLISPPPHHDIYSIEDLAQLIYDLKNANPRARISVKLVSEVGVGTVAAGVAKGHADVILISGSDGGTGASPQTSIKHAGLPWELGLAETHQTLLLNDLRSRVTLETDGQLKTGRDVVIAAVLGAEEFGFATAPLVALGCIMMRVCHLNTCPVGIATQDPALRRLFTGEPEHVINYLRFVAQEVREIMAGLGLRTVQELIGRTDLLEPTRAIAHWKTHGLDLGPILYQPEVPPGTGRYCQQTQDHGLDRAIDRTLLLNLCRPALEQGQKVRHTLPIRNIHRAVGTMLGGEITRRFGADGLPEGTITLHFQGSAGQSFGAFTPRGLNLILEGDANDYLGKGLSGARIIAYPPRGSRFEAHQNVIVGNVALYGATGGEAYISGLAGERFAVRNSGATAVVEGVGDHGCEYMTGGEVVVLGPTGRNFAAGMSGGVAYVFDESGQLPGRCNLDMVNLYPLTHLEEIRYLRDLIWRHADVTGSQRAWQLLGAWDDAWPAFVKVMPRDYERMLQAIQRAESTGLSGDDALMAAFEANKEDRARRSGN